LLLAAIGLAASVGPALAWDAGAYSAEDEQLLFTLTNQDRASAGLNALASDSYLHKEAQWRSKDMADRNYFAHKIPPDDKLVFAYMSADGYCFKVAGENIGLSTYSDAEATTRIEKAFMSSTSHRANILGDWTRMGVGAFKAADGRKLYTVLFSIPCGARATAPPAAKPTARPTARPTAKPVPVPSVTPEPTPLPMGTPFIVTPTVPPVPTAEPTAVSNAAPDGQQISLRVREKSASQGGQGPLDAVFRLLFGGILP
jgi:hypothetical protein